MTEEEILKRKQKADKEPAVKNRVAHEAGLQPPVDSPAGDPPAAEALAEVVDMPVALPPQAGESTAQATTARPTPTPEEEETRAFWREYGRELVRGSVRNIDAVGRQVILVDALLVGLYANAIAFGDLREQPLGGAQIFLYLLPIIFLLFSLLFVGAMFFLERIPLELRSPRGARHIYTEAVKNKMVFLRTGMLLLALAVIAMIGALWVYLSGV